jgi:hypothetical protein
MVDKLFLKDSRLTYFSSAKQGIIKGIEAIRRHHEEFGFVEGGKVQRGPVTLVYVQSGDERRIAHAHFSNY